MSEAEVFPLHTIESAPPAARRAMTAIADHWSFVPEPVAKLAASPRMLNGLLELSTLFESGALEPVSREVLALTVAVRNGCHCVTLHCQRLDGLCADPGIASALRVGRPLEDPRLEALREFTLRVLDTAGNVGDAELRTFLAHGYTAEQALEVGLGIGAHTLSTFANRLIGADFDPPLADYAWEP